MKNQIQLKNTIIKKLENTHAIWFSRSKSFLLFEEPAFTVFQRFAIGKNKKDITKTCQNKYGHLEENIPQFVEEIIAQIEYHDNPANYYPVTINMPSGKNNKNSSYPFVVTYQINATALSVHYQNEYLKSAIHPVLQHLEVSEYSRANHHLEIAENNKILHFSYNGKHIEAFRKEDINYFTGSVKQLMYSIVFNRGFNDWMMILHASGVIHNNQAILFSAAAGSGKSTISALLKANGFGYISDDFIAVDQQGNAYPFPAAISIKEGAFERLSGLYPELKKKELETTFIGKKVRYIPVYNDTEMQNAPYPVKALVFVNYEKNAPFIYEEVSKKEALQLLLKETWVKPEPENVQHFFNWVEKKPFYRLQYSDWNQALKAIRMI